jgi:hypothetical protein
MRANANRRLLFRDRRDHMTKLGAIKEDIPQRARIGGTGRVYDRVVFSVLAGEWPKVPANLERQMAPRGGGAR